MTEPSDSVRRRSLSGALLNRNRNARQSTATIANESRSEFNRRRATIATDITHSKVHVRIVPSIENVNRSLIFDIVDRDLEVGTILRIGRYSERHASDSCMSFKSKVVSRCHCEVWAESDGKLYIRDTKSSSGTFLNHVRLSPANTESRAVEINDGDIIQLGVDFQGGREEIYRSVKMKFEVNRSKKASRLSFNINQFQNLRALIQPPLPSTSNIHVNNTTTTDTSANISNDDQEASSPSASSSSSSEPVAVATVSRTLSTPTAVTTMSVTAAPAAPTTTPTDEHNHFDECCICLYAMAPFQALFVSPCSHSYHYKCIRPLLSSYPGFQCPICRHYSDLEASVATEEEEEEKVILADKIRPVLTNATESTTVEASTSNEQQTTIDSGLALASPSHENIAEEDEEEEEEPSASMIIHDGPSSENISSSSSSGTDEDSEELPDVEEEEDEDPAPLPAHGDNPYSTTFVSSPIIYSEPLPEPALSELATQSRTAERVTPRGRERKSSHLMDKIKMVFFEKRKSISLGTTVIKSRSNNNNNGATSNDTSNNGNNRRSRQRPLSYPNLLQSTMAEPQGETSRRPLFPLSHTLSRQSHMDTFSFRRRQNTMVES